MTSCFSFLKARPYLEAGRALAFAVALAPFLSPSLSQAALVFEKNAAQYCVSSLSAEKQTEVFSRILNLGASYSHGCTMCDANKGFRDNAVADGHFNFARRNFLARFLTRAPWKKPEEWKFEFLSVLENDYSNNLAQMYSKKELREQGYDGKWALWLGRDEVSRMTPALEEWKKKSPGFKDESALVGTGLLRRNYNQRDLSRVGVMYQTVPGQFAENGAKQKTIVDLAIDRGRSFEMLRAYGGKDLYDKLAKRGWRDAAQREIIVQNTVSYLRSFQPTVVFSVDALFWDAVPRMFHYAKLQNPKGLVTKLITQPLLSKLIGLEFYDDIQQENMLTDMFRVLEEVSRDNGTGKPIPVMLGRLIDEPGKAIKGLGLEAEFGALIGTFIEVFSGRNFTEDVTAALKKLTYESADLSGTPFEGITLSAEEHAKVRLALKNAQDIEEKYLADNSSRESTGNGVKPVLPWIVRGAMNAAVLDALGDLPMLVQSADRAFTYGNTFARAITARTSNNLQLVNVDEFYRNFHEIVSKHTMHPTPEGAERMSDLVETALCSSQGTSP
jgi:hypothetical protein